MDDKDSVVVPREPTQEMIESGTLAGIAAVWDGPGEDLVRDVKRQITAAIYKAMLSAAPSRPQEKDAGRWCLCIDNRCKGSMSLPDGWKCRAMVGVA